MIGWGSNIRVLPYMSVIPYRRDIDGLRAVAVMSVVLFHAGFESLAGGYVGVDVFFVISGYLIGAIVLKELEWGSFTFRSFYERRVRRILPALFTVLIVTGIAGHFFLLPDELMALAQASLATLFFGSNIYFWDQQSTYFGLDINTEPLLHTWSLGVEEQFYLFFPLLLWALYKRGLNRNQLFIVFGLLFAASLALNILATPFYTKFSFYMIPTRAWELLLGVMLALGVLPDVRRFYVATLLAVFGAALLVGSVVFLREALLFPGVNAVYPVLGAALLIYSGRKHVTIVHWVLGNRFVVYIGLISYSLYLWHWPVTIYTKMLWDSVLAEVFIVLLSIFLAALSYHSIENRYRGKKPQSNVVAVTHKGRLAELCIGASVILIFAIALLVMGGLPNRVPDRAYDLVGIGRERESSMKSAHDCRLFHENPHGEGPEKGHLCVIGAGDSPPKFVIWGDSHARALIPAFQAAAERTNQTGLALTSPGCRPITGVYRPSKRRCLNFNEAVLDYMRSSTDIRQVFLAGYWRVPLMGKSYDNNNFLIMDDQTVELSPAENRRVFERGLNRSLTALGGLDVFLIEDVPEIGSKYGKEVANHFLRMAWLHDQVDEDLVFEARPDAYFLALSDVLGDLRYPYQWVEVTQELCDGVYCPLMRDGRMLYADGDHLSVDGALVLSAMFQDLLSMR